MLRDRQELPGGGQPVIAGGNQSAGADAREAECSGEASVSVPEGQNICASPLQPIITGIRAWHRKRCFAMDQRKRVDLALGAYLRAQLGWSRSLPDARRKEIAKVAADLIVCGERLSKDKPHPLSDTVEFEEHGWTILKSIGSRSVWSDIEKQAVKEMELLAEQLPAWWAFGETVRGFGRASLATIVGEAGDLSNYPDKSKLWKRMGVAVMDGVRQGGLSKGAKADDWIEHAYSAQRRSRLWNIGDALIKGNRDGAYRECYLRRKEYEAARGCTKLHAHRRAQRYMEKRLLRDLWQAWRATVRMPEGAIRSLPADHSGSGA